VSGEWKTASGAKASTIAVASRAFEIELTYMSL
jgi:hypothetical protein